ncbi:transcriptional regulator, ModE family [Rhodoblastus acidophilus]|uniref:Transcriptional regulator, ModE family n=1 Tax=Rhodoblastus acidophilus TaxID=1074 RepID=A0A212RIF6_RHOAC|nr:TOBE domain-containing protein [Rhodoblastus acidophilus]MCW2317020.1 molybdate transport system regulatory protein [Rhodoblastus acidophilus]PPQ38065.1 molybdenum-dependent transcriptional regulator [Rhodoblastus acidophilus]RAI18419.1 molybdenum-dependent transcriptional regulator [Rhodoblastus acidophilus]SNB72070.1 transcriptional regulator, ModE family [Rhodoblastus acidophilus]
MTENKIDALLALHGGGRFLVGRDRIKLLEKVAEFGSIAKAAKATGFSYKTAWDSVNAVNNLLPTPAFHTRPGGRSGGGAEVTPEGLRLIATFHRLEEKLSRISNLIAEEGLEGQEEALLWTVGARVSARNVFQTEVTAVRRWPVDVEVTLSVALDQQIHAIVTNEATDDLQLAPGRRALALVKSSFIRLAPVERAEVGRNHFVGEVKARTDAERNSEIHLDIGHGKTLYVVTPRETVEALRLEPGGRAAAEFDANHVILAVS